MPRPAQNPVRKDLYARLWKLYLIAENAAYGAAQQAHPSYDPDKPIRAVRPTDCMIKKQTLKWHQPCSPKDLAHVRRRNILCSRAAMYLARAALHETTERIAHNAFELGSDGDDDAGTRNRAAVAATMIFASGGKFSLRDSQLAGADWEEGLALFQGHPALMRQFDNAFALWAADPTQSAEWDDAQVFESIASRVVIHVRDRYTDDGRKPVYKEVTVFEHVGARVVQWLSMNTEKADTFKTDIAGSFQAFAVVDAGFDAAYAKFPEPRWTSPVDTLNTYPLFPDDIGETEQEHALRPGLATALDNDWFDRIETEFNEFDRHAELNAENPDSFPAMAEIDVARRKNDQRATNARMTPPNSAPAVTASQPMIDLWWQAIWDLRTEILSAATGPVAVPTPTGASAVRLAVENYAEHLLAGPAATEAEEFEAELADDFEVAMQEALRDLLDANPEHKGTVLYELVNLLYEIRASL